MIRVGFILANSASWTGGLIYLRNLIGAVMELPERKIEPVLIIAPNTPDADIAGFGAIELIRTSLVAGRLRYKIARKASEKILRRNILLENFLKRHRIDVLSHSGYLGMNSSVPAIAWLPDFQHVRMPEFFQQEEVAARDKGYSATARFAQAILLSSADAQKDLAQFAPEALANSRILRFMAGMVKPDDKRGQNFLVETYGIDRPYFYLPNQFWRHKNHALVIDALGMLAKSGTAPLVVCSGKTEDRRNPEYFEALMHHAHEVGARPYFKVLGLVPYEHLSVLSRHSVAIINPSHFEGWSTTVEEAKSMGKAILLSDIPVHREQAPERAIYVAKDDPMAMAEAMLATLAAWSPGAEAEANATATAGLSARRIEFGQTYQTIVLEVAKHLDRDQIL
ncbi:glycosyltransferase family 1 protein [Novosphingobium resinovorum]|uniref:glycosyltransferase family 4 protein n=1 Tax=Novosphingobium TaxID=165696 RepID=UPI001B3C4F66|nr:MULTISPECIES: glycosyltransferase family 1 protein [Novosphingobium]MBF7012789.1 glycosyltransferase family 4 protein [Novosphingobium sp. HR1a]WJM27524.1 glycosyltransferase family 1 protein [Novosphingobium resinovorum]